MKKIFKLNRSLALKKMILAAVPLIGVVGCDSTETKEISAETSGYKPAGSPEKEPSTDLAAVKTPAESKQTSSSGNEEKSESTSKTLPPNVPIAPTPPEIELGKAEAELSKKDYMTLELPKTTDPVKLVEYIRANAKALQTMMEEGAQQKISREVALKRAMTLGRDMVAASTLLAANATTDEQKATASFSRLQALAQMMGMGDVASGDDLRTAATEESASEIPEVAEQATGILLALSLNDFDKGALSRDELVSQIEKVLKLKNLGQPTLEAVATAIQLIETKSNGNELALAQKLAAAFEDNPEPKLSIVSWNLAAQRTTGMQKLDQLLQTGNMDDTTPIEEAIESLITELDSPWTAAFLADITSRFEYSGKTELATKLVKKAEELAAELKSEIGKQQIAESCARFWKRSSIVGSEMSWEGLNDLDGKPFQFDEYKGKVVLFDIWATWCEPCVSELPSIKELYAKHQAEGLEVIGLNIDEKKEDLQKFLNKEQLPWKTLVSKDTTKLGFQTPFIQNLGIIGIPFVAVIGRDGKVAALHLQGEKLSQKIVELLATPASN